MPRNASKKSLFNSYILSVLFHVFILLIFSTFIVLQPEKKQEKSPQLYTPAYTYTGAITPSSFHQKSLAQHHQKTVAPSIHGISHKSILALSREVLRNDETKNAITNQKNSEPILLIGDANTPADPLIKLLGRALSAHFHYPQFEGNLGSKGKVIVSMILHPEGYFSDVQIIRSSDNPDFDAAALYATNTAPTIVGANMFISKPKFFVIGFIFD